MRNGGRVALGFDSDSDSRIRRKGREVKTERVF